MNTFGLRLRVSLFGESHGAGVGALVDGAPAGARIDMALLASDMAHRRPGGPLASARQERDEVEFLAGVHRGHTTGEPVALWIRNEDARGSDYPGAGLVPRPGHADYTSHVASRGYGDPRGGGHHSGRLTAPLVAAASVARAFAPLQVGAHLVRAGEAGGRNGPSGPPGEPGPDAASIAARARASDVKCADAGLAPALRAAVEAARRDLDSIGGTIAFRADGVPTGAGEPWFAGVEPHLAHLLFSIPAVKGVEFGAGFAAASLRGSHHNDPFLPTEPPRPGQARFGSNHAGGVLGGRASGAPIWGHVAVKPTSSLPGRPQQSVDLASGNAAVRTTVGRHDPCIALRAVPVVEACVRLALTDLLLQRAAAMDP